MHPITNQHLNLVNKKKNIFKKFEKANMKLCKTVLKQHTTDTNSHPMRWFISFLMLDVFERFIHHFRAVMKSYKIHFFSNITHVFFNHFCVARPDTFSRDNLGHLLQIQVLIV
jgi:hypothetical protein